MNCSGDDLCDGGVVCWFAVILSHLFICCVCFWFYVPHQVMTRVMEVYTKEAELLEPLTEPR